MFFPQGGDRFTAFDPATRAVTRLEFGGTDGRSLAFALADGGRVTAQRPAASTDGAAEKEILDLEQRFVTALRKRDEKGLDGLLAADLRHIGFEGQVAGKAEYMEFFKHGDWRYASYTPSDVTVKVSGATAVVTGRVSRSMVAGKETTGAFAFTHVWHRSNGNWRLTSSHVTTVR